MKFFFGQPRRSDGGSSLVVVMILLFVMSAALVAVHSYSSVVASETANNGQLFLADAAAEAAVEAVSGRLIQWTTVNNGYGPSIQDCATVGTTGNAAFPAIAGPINFPTGSKLSGFSVSTPLVYPILPDDTVVTNTASPEYLPNVATRLPVSENSLTSVTRYYFSHSATYNAKSVPSKSMTYKITVTVTPIVNTVTSPKPYTLIRYLRLDKVSPFGWCTYRLGSGTYIGNVTYSGPLYVAENATFEGPTFTDSVLYGATATNDGSSFTGGGYAAQVKQTSLLSLVPSLSNNLAVDSSGNRLASFETNSTPAYAGGPAPADMFSTREVIEPPTNPSNDTTPAVFQNARIYNQADVRIQVLVTTAGSTKTAHVSVVNVNGTTVGAASNPWVTPLLAAINVKTSAFFDRSRSTTSAVESTDIDVGALGAVMAANPTVFPTGIIYVWDATGLTSGTRPLTGVRLWDAGVLPTGGLVVGSNDPIYLKGDFNTGTTLPAHATVNTPPNTGPPSNSLGLNSDPTTEAQRTVAGYTIQPGGVFGDAVYELSNAWNDANSSTTSIASSTTINLVEGWSTNSANELRPDDTYLDVAGRSSPIWLENWSYARRTMSGQEMVAWHSRYCTTANLWVGYGWVGDISYDAKAASLKVNWGVVNFVRDRELRQ